MARLEAVSYGIVIVAVVIAILTYPAMPGEVASHWNAAGEVDGYMPRHFAAFMLPGIMLLVAVAIPFFMRRDPLYKNIEKFMPQANLLVYSILGFMLYLYVLTVAWALGSRFDMVAALLPALAVLMFVLAYVLSRSRRNYMIGIRTPWTLDSDEVWDRTHVLGSRLFRIVAFFSLLGLVFRGQAFLLFIIPLVLAIIILFGYSYFIYQKPRGKGKPRRRK